MINLQKSKNFLKDYDTIINKKMLSTQFFPSKTIHKIARQIQDESVTKQLQSRQYGKTISKMIKIQFNQKNKANNHDQIRIKRKMMTSSQKFYNRKKQNISAFIKQTYNKVKQQIKKNNQLDLAVGIHSIKKVESQNNSFYQNLKIFQGNQELNSKLKHYFKNSQFNNRNNHRDNQVVILQRENNKLQNLFATPNSYQRSPNNSNRKKLPNSTRKLQAGELFIQEYIPLKKNYIKKDHFVFGLSDKKINNDNNNHEKMAAYHDFLWKVNYSNGLYIKPSSSQTTYKIYVGNGNNSNLIKSIIHRRFWWTIVDKVQNANFIWTQLKINSIFKDYQQKSNHQSSIYVNKQVEINQKIVQQQQVNSEINESHQRIFNKIDLANWKRHAKKYHRSQTTLTQKTYKNRANFLNCKQIKRIQTPSKLIIHNHLQQNFYIGNKKALFYNMKKYYKIKGMNVFEALPLTFHISKGICDQNYKQFQNYYNQIQKQKKKGSNVMNIWIMKPGQCSNRGIGITVCHSIEDIKLRLKGREKNSDGSQRTFIVQKYLERPLLYKGRKFDIRHYMLLTSLNGSIKAYWFPQGYIRTSSTQFNLKKGNNLYIHLTNEAIQKYSQQYGKYQKGNKISYQKLNNYISKNISHQQPNIFYRSILPKMKQLAIESIRSTFFMLDVNKRQHNFQLLGMDFMIDDDLKPWLIQINTNPCLELVCPLLANIIPNFIEQTFRICVDPLFPPPQQWPINRKMTINQNILQENKLQLIFDQAIEGQQILKLYGNNLGLDSKIGKVEQDAQVYQNQGVEEWEEKKN